MTNQCLKFVFRRLLSQCAAGDPFGRLSVSYRQLPCRLLFKLRGVVPGLKTIVVLSTMWFILLSQWSHRPLTSTVGAVFLLFCLSLGGMIIYG
jgi:hypothetical protein